MKTVFAMQASPLMQHCFPGSLGYSKCCRYAEDSWMRETMQPMCWPDGKRNFELCCFFRFGPTLRGLPFESEDADGVVFDFRSLQLKLRSSGSPGFWPAA